MICVGETLAEREAGNALTTVIDQLATSIPATLPTTALTIAYEPVWAIGTGVTATPEQAQETQAAVRAMISEGASAEVAAALRIQYEA